MRSMKLRTTYDDSEVYFAYLIVTLSKNNLDYKNIKNKKRMIIDKPQALKKLRLKYGILTVHTLNDFETQENCCINLYFQGKCIREGVSEGVPINIGLIEKDCFR